jgi:hypothetical protein
MKRPAVLFARSDSVYKTLDCDVWDAERNALNWPGGSSIVAHPPCRGWGSLRKLSHATPSEKALGPWAADQVRRWGGVLEHPAKSTLWDVAALPRPGVRDCFGGFTFAAPQWWWGHRAEKMTWFYIVGVEPSALPGIPLRLGQAERVITNRHGLRAGQPGYRSEVTKRERDATPPPVGCLVAVCG